MRIALVGDYDVTISAHQAIPVALQLASDVLSFSIEFEWIPTEEILDTGVLETFDGIWCVPASPYRNMNGALLAIQYAREKNVPFLGTCAGFQHALIEYARNVLGWLDAEHEETAPGASRLVIHQMECALVEKTKTVYFNINSKISTAYGCATTEEGYRCRFGLNPIFESAYFRSGQLRISGRDASGEVRAVELSDDHPFFIATLFQPERSALRGEPPPLVIAFVQSTQLYYEARVSVKMEPKNGLQAKI